MMQAKMIVTNVERQRGTEVLHMQPVASDSRENASYSKWTPAGSLTLHVTNENLFGQFNPGDEYVLDFTKVEPTDGEDTRTG